MLSGLMDVILGKVYQILCDFKLCLGWFRHTADSSKTAFF